MPQKLNNDRKYPGVNHQPCHKAKFRVDEAKERQEAYNNLSIQQKIALLDTRLGTGVGAVKQRARLAVVLAEQNKPKPEAPKTASTLPEQDKKDNNKKYMKGSRQ